MLHSLVNIADYKQLNRKSGSRDVYIPVNPNGKVIKVESIESAKKYSGVQLTATEILRHHIVSKSILSKNTLGNKVTYLGADASLEKQDDLPVIVYSETYLPEYYLSAKGLDICYPEVHKIKNLMLWYQQILQTEEVFRNEAIYQGLIDNGLIKTADIVNRIELDMDLWSILFELVNITRKYFLQTRCVLDMTGSKNIFVRLAGDELELVFSNSAAKAYFNIDKIVPCHRETKSTPIPGNILNFLDSTIWMNLICLLLEEEPVYSVQEIANFFS
jgi:hypothetical protein